MVSDGEGPSPPCIQVQAPLLTQSCGRCMKGMPPGAPSHERPSFLVRFTLSSSRLCPHCSEPVCRLLSAVLSGCLRLSVFFAHCFLTLRDSWHLPPSPPKADPSRRKATVPLLGSLSFYFRAPHGSGLRGAQSPRTTEWFVPDRPPCCVGLCPPAALDKPGDE